MRPPAAMRRGRAPGDIGVAVRSAGDRVRDALGPAALRRRRRDLERRVGITRSGWIALVAAVIVWILGRVVAGTAMYITAYGAIALLGVAVVLAPRRVPLTGERTGLRPRVHEGDRLDVDVTLTARRGLSAFVVEEQVPAKLGSNVRVPVVRLAAGAGVVHHYTLRCARRGAYTVGPLVAVAGDPLGLYRRETVVAEPFELLVHPRIEIVDDRPLTRQFEDPPIRPPVSKPWPSGLEFYGMREYVPGDDLRRIVWRASARTGTIMVREAEQGITDKVTLVLDTDRGGHSNDGDEVSESFETGVRAVASLGVRHLREGYEVRVETNSGPLTRPLRGAGSQLQLLDALARLGETREPLSKVLLRLMSRPRRDAHHIVVTPRLGVTETAQLRQLLNTGVSVLVIALLWSEDSAETLTAAAGLGCQVTGVHPGQDLRSALTHGVGAGTR